MQHSSPQPTADRVREISTARYKAWDALAFFASHLTSLGICFVIWSQLHPHAVKAPGWFDALVIAVSAVSALAAALATVHLARVNRLSAISAVVFGAMSGVLLFFVYRLAPL
jgi:hypothetical protein